MVNVRRVSTPLRATGGINLFIIDTSPAIAWSTPTIIDVPNVVIPDLRAVGTTVDVPIWTKVSGGDAIAARRGFPLTYSACEG